MKLANIQFEFKPDADGGLKCCLPGKPKALARMVPDAKYPNMWRVVKADGTLSDMLNRTRAKDCCWGLAETEVYLGRAGSARL